jgi:hypothetical protein
MTGREIVPERFEMNRGLRPAIGKQQIDHFSENAHAALTG